LPTAPSGKERLVATTTPPAKAHGPFSRKPHSRLLEESGDSTLRRSVGALDLTALGVGAIIGTGIFVIIGEAISQTGASIVISFMLAGLTCAFSALSYAELSSTIPISGSAYTYGYATMGELVAWIIGWDLILEYGVSVAGIAVGWGGYLKSLLDSLFGITLPDAIAQPPGEGGTVNLPAVLIVVIVATLLILGVRKAAKANLLLVGIKLAILAFFIVVAFTAFHGSHFSPFATHGFSGTVDAASVIFFAYIGFDAVSTSGEEAEKPSRDLPIGILASLAICTVVYILVSIAAVGALEPSKLAGAEDPLAKVITDGVGIAWAGDLISFGALVAIASVCLTILYGQTRVAFAMSRDGLLPRGFGKTSEKYGTPVMITALFGFLVAVLAALVPLKEIAELVNIGTLFAFLIVNIGVIVLRRTEPDLDRSFRTPLVPIFPIIGGALCIYLMTRLPGLTWARFGVWLAIGFVVYFTYSRRHSRLRHELSGS
jgi:APA family basic amino acid/polyamine antiporter